MTNETTFGEFDAALDVHMVPKREPRPPRLYHYTTEAGLQGIVGSKKIWATHYGDTNDRTELRHADAEILAVIGGLAGELGDGSRRILDEFISHYPAKAARQIAPMYIASFSETPDILAQWQTYADDANGFCIGFEVGQADTGDVSIAGLAAQLFRVEYGVERLIPEFRSDVLQILNLWNGSGVASDEPRLRDRTLKALLQRAAYVSLGAKNEYFHHEREWRVVAMPRVSETYVERKRGNPTAPIRYVDLPLLDASDASLIRSGEAGLQAAMRMAPTRTRSRVPCRPALVPTATPLPQRLAPETVDCAKAR